MSAPYVNCRVRVQGTSQVDLNGQEGVATSYSAESMRYTVQLSSGRSVALKVANLDLIGESEPSGGGGGFPGMPQGMGMPDVSQYLHMLPGWLREKLSRGQAPNLDDLRRLLPQGVTPMHVASIAAAFLLMLFKFGVMKTVLLFGILGFILKAGAPAFAAAGGGVAGLRAAGGAVGEDLSGRIRGATQRNIPPHLSLAALGAGLLAVMYYIFLTGGGGAAHSPLGYTADRTALSAADAYDKGYDDAIAGRPHSWADHASAFRSYTPAPEYYAPPASASSGGFGFGKMITVGILGKQIYSMGAVPGGGWDHNFALANFMNQSTMQKVFMGFMVLRLFGMSPI